MPSLASRAMPLIITLRGSKRYWNSAEVTLARVAELQIRPQLFGPPRGLERIATVERRTVAGWPVYEVGPRPDRRRSGIRGPADDARRRAIYLHGGAYVYQITVQHWRFVARLAADTGARITVPIYPLPPAATASEIVPTVADLTGTLVSEVGADRVTVLGDSAGGGMALAAAMVLRDRGVPAPRLVLIAPWLDVSGTDPELAALAPRDPWLAVPGSRAAGRVYAGDLADDDPLVSPIHGDFRGLGPITMFSGTRDILNADARRLLRHAAAAGVPVDFHEVAGMIHVYPLLPIREAAEARAVIAASMLR